MQLAVLANNELKEELLAVGIDEGCEIEWVNSPAELVAANADVVVDLLFEINAYDDSHLKDVSNKLIFVNSVCKTIDEIGMSFIRINGWPGFLKRDIAEICYADEIQKEKAIAVFSLLNRKVEFIPDVKGFVSARVISMIINEAYFALEENVSTKDEIDIAMKLGTNYPYGPFEWADRIGLKKIADLLLELSKREKRYEPSNLLLKEAGK